jgi:hypothetical protein
MYDITEKASVFSRDGEVKVAHIPLWIFMKMEDTLE